MLRDYIYNKNFQIYIFEDKINILNYYNIISFTDNNVVLNCNKKIISITGNELVISKLLTDELLITGKILNIEFR